MTKEYISKLSYVIIGLAIEVHKTLGPGLLESVYETCLVEEFKRNEIGYERQVEIPIEYKGLKLKNTMRIDLLVENSIIVELKAVEKMNPIYDAQLLTYMKLSQKPKGILINFNTTYLMKDLKQFVNEIFRDYK